MRSRIGKGRLLFEWGSAFLLFGCLGLIVCHADGDIPAASSRARFFFLVVNHAGFDKGSINKNTPEAGLPGCLSCIPNPARGAVLSPSLAGTFS